MSGLYAMVAKRNMATGNRKKDGSWRPLKKNDDRPIEKIHRRKKNQKHLTFDYVIIVDYRFVQIDTKLEHNLCKETMAFMRLKVNDTIV